MQPRIVSALSIVMIMTLGLLGCGERNGAADTGQAPVAALPEVTSAAAEEAMSDAMLISALSLFLAFSASEGDTKVTNEEGSLTLEWDDTADFTTGAGLYTITMANYSIPDDDPFAAEYNGYVLDGTVVMGSTDGISTKMTMDLATSHPDADNYTVQSIDLELEGIQDDSEQMPTGHIRINGHEMSFEDLAQALELGS